MHSLSGLRLSEGGIIAVAVLASHEKEVTQVDCGSKRASGG